uniref:Uncharacterized protein n=1 Tax=Arundo donax TaxID=35708 RepID=A0A0A9BXE1_ARUDO
MFRSGIPSNTLRAQARGPSFA